MNFKNRDECREFILKLANSFKERQILLLEGQMGSGKTQLVSWLVDEYGAESAKAGASEAAASPTYAFHHVYPSERVAGGIQHFDLDRIQSDSDLESIGFWDIFSHEAGWVIIEWPERINIKHLPRDWARVHLKISRSSEDENSESRSIEILTP